jgi:hypothetical protein
MKVLMKRIIPQTLGGDSINIWNVLISRVQGVSDVYFDRRLNIHVLPDNRWPIWEFIRRHECKNILEIGLGVGENAEKMLELAGDDCNYYSFDNLSRPESWRAYMRLKGRKNVKFYIGESRETLSKVVDNLPKMDLILIDGGHTYDVVKSDWEHCKKLMHSKTAVFFHDYLPKELEVKKAVDEIDSSFSVEIIRPRLGPPFALVRQRGGVEVKG